MDHFNYINDKLCAEKVALDDIAARWGTPCFVYSRATLERHWRVFDQSLAQQSHLICYSVKANSNLAVLNVLAKLGSGFDIVSGGELARVIEAGGDPGLIVFSGVGKASWEISAALKAGIYCFNVESQAELLRINELATEHNCLAAIALRINPDVDPKTHPYISTGLQENKFGVAMDEALELYRHASTLSHIKIRGIACHIGSQLTTLEPFVEALTAVLSLQQQLLQYDISIEHIDLGGGLGVCYGEEQPPLPKDYSMAILSKLNNPKIKLVIEPGRAIAANAGVLLTKVDYIKQTADKAFAIVDAGMNDLLRPALYDAWQTILPISKDPQHQSQTYDVVGPVCESGDFFARCRQLAIANNSLLAIRTTGAYGFVMSSNYNSRPRAAEVMVDGAKAHLIRQRERVEDLYALEAVLP